MAFEINSFVMENQAVVLAWLVILTIVVFCLVFFNKEKFLGEFVSAPIASRKPTSFLGNGNPLRFSTEFSSTNQSGSNAVSETEHMVAGPESPMWMETPRLLEEGRNTEGFRPMFESFSTEDKLKNIMMGH